MQTNLRMVLIALAVCIFPVAYVSAQCYTDTGKHTCFEYSSQQIFARPWCFGACYQVQESFTAALNPNTSGMYVKVSLIADDANYEYLPTCSNPRGDGKCVGTYDYPTRWFNGYSQTERWLGWYENFISFAFSDSTTFSWSGKIRVESISQYGVPQRSFYSVNPSYSNVTGIGSTPYNARHTAWNSFDKYLPVVWDSDINRIVFPYANMWHRDNEWPVGWQTTVSMQNSTGSSQTYHLENHLVSGGHGHTGSLCSETNDNEIETSFTLANGASTSVDAFRFHMSDSAKVTHDTSLFIRIDGPILGGNSPSIRVYPNSSGTQCQ